MRAGRTFLRAILVLSLALGFTPLLGATSWTFEVPKTLHERVKASPADVRSARLKSLPFVATHLGFDWTGSEEGLDYRTSRNGVSWTEWTPLIADEDMSDHETGHFFSLLVPGKDARFVELRTSEGSEPPAVTISAINTRDGPRRIVRSPLEARAATPQPGIISRADWGADESLRKGTTSFARVRRIFVHHTATANNDPNPAGTIRAIYSYHTQSNGWNDIGYNFIVDTYGNIYEGRYSRPYGAGEIPSGEDLNGSGVIGAHVAGYNTGSVGIAVLGSYGGVDPTDATLDALVNLIAWKADRHGINPLGSYGGLATILGHRDAAATACPGENLYWQLPSVRTRSEERITSLSGGSAPSMPAGTELMPKRRSRDTTPNASGAVSRSATRVELKFTPPSGDPRVFNLPASGGGFALTASSYSDPLERGRYRVTAVAFDSLNQASPEAVVEPDYAIIDGKIPTGYWVMGSDGGIFSFGSAAFYGSTGGMRLNQPAVALDSTPLSDGYWMVASDGGIFAFGAAGFFGSTGGMRLNRPIVDMASTPSGNGYWLVASDGGIFAFGDAGFYGSTGAIALRQPIVGMAPAPSGRGYWLVASDGGIFAFGDAGFHGSTGALRLASPIVGMAGTGSGNGYWMVGGDGGIFTFGDGQYQGSLPGRGVKATASTMLSTGTNAGYYILLQGGGIYEFGDAAWYGSPNSLGLQITALDMAPSF